MFVILSCLLKHKPGPDKSILHNHVIIITSHPLTSPTEPPPIGGEVRANFAHFCRYKNYKLYIHMKQKQNKLRRLSPRANYTARATVACRRSVNFCGQRLACGQRDRSLRPYSRFSRPESLLFLPSSSSILLTRLTGSRSWPTTFQEIW
jgi:hypothetical protein